VEAVPVAAHGGSMAGTSELEESGPRSHETTQERHREKEGVKASSLRYAMAMMGQRSRGDGSRRILSSGAVIASAMVGELARERSGMRRGSAA